MLLLLFCCRHVLFAHPPCCWCVFASSDSSLPFTEVLNCSKKENGVSQPILGGPSPSHPQLPSFILSYLYVVLFLQNLCIIENKWSLELKYIVLLYRPWSSALHSTPYNRIAQTAMPLHCAEIQAQILECSASIFLNSVLMRFLRIKITILKMLFSSSSSILLLCSGRLSCFLGISFGWFTINSFHGLRIQTISII